MPQGPGLRRVAISRSEIVALPGYVAYGDALRWFGQSLYVASMFPCEKS
jgi:hypothetical protein